MIENKCGAGKDFGTQPAPIDIWKLMLTILVRPAIGWRTGGEGLMGSARLGEVSTRTL